MRLTAEVKQSAERSELRTDAIQNNPCLLTFEQGHTRLLGALSAIASRQIGQLPPDPGLDRDGSNDLRSPPSGNDYSRTRIPYVGHLQGAEPLMLRTVPGELECEQIFAESADDFFLSLEARPDGPTFPSTTAQLSASNSGRKTSSGGV